MKKIFNVLPIAAAFAALSCTATIDETINPDNSKGEMTTLTSVDASIDEADTRATMNADGSITFEAGDMMRIYSDTDNTGVDFTTVAGGATARFGHETGVEGTTFKAVFPSTAYYLGSMNVVKIPRYQTYVAGGFAKESTVMIGQIDGTTLSLKQACGLWRLPLKGSEAGQQVEKITLRFGSTAKPAGQFRISNFGTGAITFYGANYSEIELSCSPAVALSTETATDFHFSLAPGTYNGFTLVVTLSDGRSMLKELPSAAMTIQRAKITAAKTPLTFAETSLQGEGTAASPYLIGSLNDWDLFVKTVNSGANDYQNEVVKLTADLNFTGRDFTQVGYYLSGVYDQSVLHEFKGTFDGDNKTIKNIVHSTDQLNAGIFRSCGSIKNLIVDNCTITSTYTSSNPPYNSNAAILWGGRVSGTIDNCTIKNSSITANYAYVGAICPNLEGGTISNCTVENCTVKSSGGIVGAITGYANRRGADVEAYITNCRSIDNIIEGMNCIGGIAGQVDIDVNISSCLALRNNIKSTSGCCGGIVGEMESSTLDCCLARGNTIDCDSYNSGGIFGRTVEQYAAKIYNCISDGNHLISDASYVGGIGGSLNHSVAINCLSKNCRIDVPIGHTYVSLGVGNQKSSTQYPATLQNCLITSGTISLQEDGWIGIVAGKSDVQTKYTYYPQSLRSTVMPRTTLNAFGLTSGSEDTVGKCTAVTDVVLTGSTSLAGALLSTLNGNVAVLNRTNGSMLRVWVAGSDYRPTFAFEETLAPLPALATPTGLTHNGFVTSWTAVPNATSYDYYVDDVLAGNTTSTSVNFFGKIATGAAPSIKIVAKANGYKSSERSFTRQVCNYYEKLTAVPNAGDEIIIAYDDSHVLKMPQNSEVGYISKASLANQYDSVNNLFYYYGSSSTDVQSCALTVEENGSYFSIKTYYGEYLYAAEEKLFTKEGPNTSNDRGEQDWMIYYDSGSAVWTILTEKRSSGRLVYDSGSTNQTFYLPLITTIEADPARYKEVKVYRLKK